MRVQARRTVTGMSLAHLFDRRRAEAHQEYISRSDNERIYSWCVYNSDREFKVFVRPAFIQVFSRDRRGTTTMIHRQTFSAVLFDLDGTLLDTLEDLADSMNAVLERLGSPAHPVGPCMVSSEGTCAAHYRYGSSEINL